MKIECRVGSLPVGSFVWLESIYYRVIRQACSSTMLEAGYDAFGDKFFDGGVCSVKPMQVVTLVIRVKQ